MRAVIQRAREAKVLINDEVVGEIDHGLVVLLGVTHEDTEEDLDYLVNKIVNLRIFSDDEGRMNLSLKDVAGSILSISQFTLYGDTRKGRRPNFMQAAAPGEAESLYDRFNEKIAEAGVEIETGVFGEMMDVQLINDGPVTLIIDSQES